MFWPSSGVPSTWFTFQLSGSWSTGHLKSPPSFSWSTGIALMSADLTDWPAWSCRPLFDPPPLLPQADRISPSTATGVTSAAILRRFIGSSLSCAPTETWLHDFTDLGVVAGGVVVGGAGFERRFDVDALPLVLFGQLGEHEAA